jgi:hypothetical protein
MKMPIPIFLSAVLGAGLIAVTASTHAATLTVTSTADSGAGTLRNALASAANGDTINFSITGRITLTTGELLITNNVTILGPGPARLAVDGNANRRVFHATNGVIATIAGLTITNGNATGDLGGGIYNDHSTLSVSNCILIGNKARFGGSLYNDGIGSGVGSATLSVSDCTISTNSAGIAGAGIFNNGIGGHATLTVSNSTFRGNSTASNGNGAGIYNDAQSSGSAILSVNACSFIDNAAYFGSGGGIYNDAGTVTVGASTFSGNLAYDPGGGGIYNPGGTVTVSASTFSGNSASSGGGILNDGSSGGSAMLSVNTSTFSGNSASAIGGGICNDGIDGTATGLVATCTFSTNAAINGGGIYNAGASSSNTTLRINASTLSGNSASGGGGGIFNDGSSAGHATLEIGDTILNSGASGVNITNALGTVISRGYNLSSDNGGGFLIGTNDQINTNPILGPLANNGGPTFTHALLIGSPAFDKGKRDAIPSLALNTDQRGQPRPFDFPSIANALGGDGSDIGAFEANPPPLNIVASGTNLVLSWLLEGPGFRLESVTNFAASNNWTLISATPVAIGNWFYVTTPSNASHKFYRLIYP